MILFNRVKKRRKQLDKSIDYLRTKIIYHENAHLLTSYLVGFSCQEIEYTIDVDIELNNGSYIGEFQSRANAEINIPQKLDLILTGFTIGITVDQIVLTENGKISKQELEKMLYKYLLVLLAGKAGETSFDNPIRHFFKKRFIKKYSLDMNVNPFSTDELKIETVMKGLGLFGRKREELITKCENYLDVFFRATFISKTMKDLSNPQSNVFSKLEIETKLEKSGVIDFCENYPEFYS